MGWVNRRPLSFALKRSVFALVFTQNTVTKRYSITIGTALHLAYQYRLRGTGKRLIFHQSNNQKTVGEIRGNTILGERSRPKMQKAVKSALFPVFSIHQAIYLRIEVAHFLERFRISKTKRAYTLRAI